MAPFPLFLHLSFHAYVDLESYNLSAHKSNFLLLSFFHDRIKTVLFWLISANFLPFFPFFSLFLRHIEIALLNSWQYNSKIKFWYAIFWV